MEFLKSFPIEWVYGIFAVVGGVSRYLNSYTKGEHFSWKIFLASAVVSGFSGFMFALVGDSMHLPYPIPQIMAGAGGFFGDQTMKLVYEWIQKKPA